MDWDQIQGQWRHAAGQPKSTWGKATDDDLQNVAGKRRLLLGRLQERYGLLKDDAEKQIDDWLAKSTS